MKLVRVRYVAILLALLFSTNSFAERVKVVEIMVVGSNVQYIFKLETNYKKRNGKKRKKKKKKVKIAYARPGFPSDLGEAHSGALYWGKYKRERLTNMYFDTEQEQLYLVLKKSGKQRLTGLELLEKQFRGTTYVFSYLSMALDAAGLFLIPYGWFNESSFEQYLGYGLLGLSAITWYGASLGDYEILELNTCDIFYKIDDESGYEVFQKAHQSAGTFPHNLKNLKIE